MDPKIQNSKVQNNIFLDPFPWGNRLFSGNSLVIEEIPGYLHQGGSEENGVGQRKKLNSVAVKNKGLSGNTT